MYIINHEESQWVEWRPGVRSRAWATASSGAKQIRIAEQILDQGTQAPPHWHYFEENITVIAGAAHFQVDGEFVELGSGNTVIVPSTAVHGFVSIGDEPLHIIAAVAWPIQEIHYEDNANVFYRSGEVGSDGSLRRIEVAGV